MAVSDCNSSPGNVTRVNGTVEIRVQFAQGGLIANGVQEDQTENTNRGWNPSRRIENPNVINATFSEREEILGRDSLEDANHFRVLQCHLIIFDRVFRSCRSERCDQARKHLLD